MTTKLEHCTRNVNSTKLLWFPRVWASSLAAGPHRPGRSHEQMTSLSQLLHFTLQGENLPSMSLGITASVVKVRVKGAPHFRLPYFNEFAVERAGGSIFDSRYTSHRECFATLVRWVAHAAPVLIRDT